MAACCRGFALNPMRIQPRLLALYVNFNPKRAGEYFFPNEGFSLWATGHCGGGRRGGVGGSERGEEAKPFLLFVERDTVDSGCSPGGPTGSYAGRRNYSPAFGLITNKRQAPGAVSRTVICGTRSSGQGLTLPGNRGRCRHVDRPKALCARYLGGRPSIANEVLAVNVWRGGNWCKPPARNYSGQRAMRCKA